MRHVLIRRSLWALRRGLHWWEDKRAFLHRGLKTTSPHFLRLMSSVCTEPSSNRGNIFCLY